MRGQNPKWINVGTQSGMEPREENSWVLVWKLREKKKSYDASFFKTWNSSWNVFLRLPQVWWVGVSLLPINHSCLLLLFDYVFTISTLCLYERPQRPKFLPCAACPCDYMQPELMRTLLMWFFLTLIVEAVGGWGLHETLGSVLPGPTAKVVNTWGTQLNRKVTTSMRQRTQVSSSLKIATCPVNVCKPPSPSTKREGKSQAQGDSTSLQTKSTW